MVNVPELLGVSWLGHASIRINRNNNVIYIDPFKIHREAHDATLILCTHMHFDHFSEEDIIKVSNPNTTLVVTRDGYTQAQSLGLKIMTVGPDEKFDIDQVHIETIRSYNKNKHFHPKENQWVGYVVEIEGTRWYIAGDTDHTTELDKVNADVFFLPVGGTYTMNVDEAAGAANRTKPKYAVPIHYASLVGNAGDGEQFINLLIPEVTGVLLNQKT